MSRLANILKNSRWTKTAIECYVSRFNCKKCKVYKVLGKKCRMKQSVMGLVELFGAPCERNDILNE